MSNINSALFTSNVDIRVSPFLDDFAKFTFPLMKKGVIIMEIIMKCSKENFNELRLWYRTIHLYKNY